MRTLVLGGIRSGKSRWAEEAIAGSLPPGRPVRVLAPGRVDDADAAWAERVARHRSRRPPHWATVETEEIAAQLRLSPDTPALIDDLGAWLTAVLDRTNAWGDGSPAAPAHQMIDDMLAAVTAFAAPLMMVSPEVGLTVVPATAAGRRFADELGGLNQRVAEVCDRVVLVVAGQAVPIKPSGI